MRPFFPGAAAQGSPMALLLSPTRELAIQTEKECQLLLKGTNLRSVCVYGGEALRLTVQRIVERQTDILIGTPGRITDMVDQGKLSMCFVQMVVIDEADQMLEQQGLDKVVEQLLIDRDLPPKDARQ